MSLPIRGGPPGPGRPAVCAGASWSSARSSGCCCTATTPFFTGTTAPEVHDPETGPDQRGPRTGHRLLSADGGGAPAAAGWGGGQAAHRGQPGGTSSGAVWGAGPERGGAAAGPGAALCRQPAARAAVVADLSAPGGRFAAHQHPGHGQLHRAGGGRGIELETDLAAAGLAGDRAAAALGGRPASPGGRPGPLLAPALPGPGGGRRPRP